MKKISSNFMNFLKIWISTFSEILLGVVCACVAIVVGYLIARYIHPIALILYGILLLSFMMAKGIYDS